MTQLLITGRAGRMGQALMDAAELAADAECTSTHEKGENLLNAFKNVDAAIDFTVHNFTESVIQEALATQTPLVIGTTGHSAEERQVIIEASKKIPIVFAANYSVGVNTLFSRHSGQSRMVHEWCNFSLLVAAIFLMCK